MVLEGVYGRGLYDCYSSSTCVGSDDVMWMLDFEMDGVESGGGSDVEARLERLIMSSLVMSWVNWERQL